MSLFVFYSVCFCFIAPQRRPASEIVSVDIRAPEHHSAFGPCVDGIVVAREPHVLMEEHAMAQFKSYDVMFGVTSIEVMYTCIYYISSSICVCYVCKSVLYC